MMEKFLVNGGCVSKRRSLWECLVPAGNKVDSFRYLVCVKYPIWLVESMLFGLREISNLAIGIPSGPISNFGYYPFGLGIR